MKKYLIFTALLMTLILSFSSCSSGDSTHENGSSTFSLNETATFKDLKFTATEITENTGTNTSTPAEGQIFVGIKFTIENTSSEEQAVNRLLTFALYCDDVKLEYSISAAYVFGEKLEGTLEAGEKMVGYYAVEAPINWTTIKLEVKEDWMSNDFETFVFNK